MSKFLTPLKVEVIDNFKFRIIEEFSYHVGSYDSEDKITVPVGYETDFASIPKFMWGVLPPHGKYAKAAVIHDYLYSHAIISKEYADNVFNEAMTVLGVNDNLRFLMFSAVKLFGKGNY